MKNRQNKLDRKLFLLRQHSPLAKAQRHQRRKFSTPRDCNFCLVRRGASFLIPRREHAKDREWWLNFQIELRFGSARARKTFSGMLAKLLILEELSLSFASRFVSQLRSFREGNLAVNVGLEFRVDVDHGWKPSFFSTVMKLLWKRSRS